jgi:hypothetical protein
MSELIDEKESLCEVNTKLAAARLKLEEVNMEILKLEVGKVALRRAYPLDSIININVGGQHFTTSLATLTRFPETMLGSMFSGRHKLVTDDSGHFFIDRDGSHFLYVLNFLRNPSVFDPSELDAPSMEKLKIEADFYGIADLMFPKQEAIPSKKNEKGTATTFLQVNHKFIRGSVEDIIFIDYHEELLILEGQEPIKFGPYSNTQSRASLRSKFDFTGIKVIDLSC